MGSLAGRLNNLYPWHGFRIQRAPNRGIKIIFHYEMHNLLCELLLISFSLTVLSAQEIYHINQIEIPYLICQDEQFSSLVWHDMRKFLFAAYSSQPTQNPYAEPTTNNAKPAVLTRSLKKDCVEAKKKKICKQNATYKWEEKREPMWRSSSPYGAYAIQ